MDAICGKAKALKFINEKDDSLSAQLASEVIDLVELARRKDDEAWEEQTKQIKERYEIFL